MTSGSIAIAPSLEEARGLSASYNVIPLAHRFLDDTETPVSAFLKLRQAAGCFLLESAEQGLRLGRYSFLGIKAWESVRLTGDTVTVRHGGVDTHYDLTQNGGDPFAFMARHLSRYRVPPLEDAPPFVGGAVGYFGYDCVRHVERLPNAPADDLGLPDMAFLLTDVIVVFDHLRHTITLLTNIFCDEEPDLDRAYEAAAARLAEVKTRLRGPLPEPGWSLGRSQALTQPQIQSNFERQRFEQGVERIREYIYAGDAFQVVLSQRFERPVNMSGFSIYRGLRAVNPSPYMYYMSFRDFEIVGSSPEPLVTVTGGRAETRPIAGTRPRGVTPEEDAALAAEMLADEKERAEHLMLVDLGRNDLGRVCRAGHRAHERVHGGRALQPRDAHGVVCHRGTCGGSVGRRRSAGGLPGRYRLGGAQGARHGDHRRTGADPQGSLRRRHRISELLGRTRLLHLHPHHPGPGRPGLRAGGRRHSRRLRPRE